MTERVAVDDPSPARQLVRRIVADFGREAAHKAIDVMLAQLPLRERAALAAYWPFWARPKQIMPPGPWRRWGFLTGRGFGKSDGISHAINEEVEAGRLTQIGLAAQDEENTVLLGIHGPVGLIATSPPWFRPEYESTHKILHWPNGARAIVRTPERPDKIRGFEYEMFWALELQSWPKTTRTEAFSNAEIATRRGRAQLVWDATPKRGHEILLQLLAEHAIDPEHYRIVRGSTLENKDALGPGYVEDLMARVGGTRKELEEVWGEMPDETERALVHADWFTRGRCEKFIRRCIAIDPSVTTRAGNDRTGIIDAGLGIDARCFVLGDYSGRHTPSEWANIVIDKYLAGKCDCVVLERNKAGDLVVQNLRAAAQSRGIAVIVLEEGEVKPHNPKIIHVREVYARGPKEDRAQPMSTAYEKRRIVHVFGADLSALEELLTTWEPEAGHRSPDALDALVHAVNELLGLSMFKIDPKQGFRGLREINKAIGQHRSGAVTSEIARRLLARRESV